MRSWTQASFVIVLSGLLAPLAAGGWHYDVRYRFILPQDYVGWVRVDFSVESAPELDVSDDMTATIIVPDRGLVQTSTTLLHGARESYLLYYRIDDRLVRVPKALYSNTFMLDGFSYTQRKPSGESWALSWYFLIGPETLRKRYPTKSFLQPGATPPEPGRIKLAPDQPAQAKPGRA
jgi:hypothetical protein